MKKQKLTAILLIAAMIAAACLAGCGSGQEPAEEPAEEPAQEAAQEDSESVSSPGSHQAYGISYDVPETDWIYMLSTGQPDDDETIDMEIIGKEYEGDLEAVWNKTRPADNPDDKYAMFKKSGKETVGGKECYWYDNYSDGDLSKVLLIPQADEKKYIEIKSEYLEVNRKDKSDEFFDGLLKGIEFTDDEGFIACKDYISLGGVRIPADGINPFQFFYGLMDEDDTDGLVSAQLDFDFDSYDMSAKEIFDEMEWEDISQVLGDGPIEINGTEGKWYTWIDNMPDSLPYLSHVIIVPVDDLKAIMTITYDFDADVDDLSKYDGRIKELDEMISGKN